MTARFLERQACPACESSDVATAYSATMTKPPIREYLVDFYGIHIELEYLQDIPFVLNECPGCGLIYQRWVPDAFLLQKLYDQWIDPDTTLKEHRQLDDLRHHRELADELSLMLALTGQVPSEVSALDFGMGWGNWARMAAAFGCHAYGTELSQRRVAHAARFGVEAITLKDREGAFDLINADQVFEHLVAPLSVLKTLAWALKPKGLLKIGVPNGGGVKRRLLANDWSAPQGSRRSLNAVAPLEHLNCFTSRSLVKMGRAAGLAPVEVPLLLQYRYTTLHGWSPRAVAKFAGRPLRRRFGPDTYRFFRKSTD